MPDTPVIAQVTLTRQRDTVVGHRVGESGDMLVMACGELPLFLAGVRLRRGESVDVELRGVPLSAPYRKDAPGDDARVNAMAGGDPTGGADIGGVAFWKQRATDWQMTCHELSAEIAKIRDAKDAQERRHALELGERDVSPSEENL